MRKTKTGSSFGLNMLLLGRVPKFRVKIYHFALISHLLYPEAKVHTLSEKVGREYSGTSNYECPNIQPF